jgi:hypothetical protein
MASVWEVLDPSTLFYDSTLGFTGSNPDGGIPSGSLGWMRNGVQPYNTAGQPGGFANCLTWTTTSGVGTVWSLDPLRILASVSEPSPWSPIEFSCAQVAPVWCVED